MLGKNIFDPNQVESSGISEITGMELLETETVFSGEKIQKQAKGFLHSVTGIFSELNGIGYEGYEIHMGRNEESLPIFSGRNNCYGSYIHGIFDAPYISDIILKAICKQKGIEFSQLTTFSPYEYKERQYDLLADTIREGMDMELVYRILNREV